MRDRDPEHWLYRFTPEEWLRAAAAELLAAERALLEKQYRAGVTQARRAAGMAWNAVLAATSDETGYGRSYMDHLKGIASDVAVDEQVRVAARALLDAPLAPQVVQLGRGDTRLAAAAEVIFACARGRVAPVASS